jgi:hypothetical protein
VLFSLLIFKTYSSDFTLFYRVDTLEIKKWTKNDFVNKFGFNDTAKALINLFLNKNKNGEYQTIIGGVFLIGGIAAMATPFEQTDAIGFGYLIRPVAEPGAAALGLIFTTSGIIKWKKYSLRKLYSLLAGYKERAILPERYKRKLKKKHFSTEE